MAKVVWKNEPDAHDYPAAAAYLSLLAGAAEVDRLVATLTGAPIELHKAKDILRAASLPVLGVDNAHVAADLAKVAKGRPLSPVLLVRGGLDGGRPLQIADGYHRVCAAQHADEDTDIPCRVAGLDSIGH